MAAQTVAPGKIVGIYYTLKDAAGTVLDTNRRGGKPLLFLHGSGNVLPALEAALAGKVKDDEVNVVLSARDGYGEVDPALHQRLPRSAFPAGRKLEVGMQFSGKSAEGRALPVAILGFEGDEVLVDHNHPLAGRELHFQVTIVGVRDASEEERTHGHPHGPGGHHH